MSILDNIRHIQKEIAKIAKDCNRNPSSIRLIAVSKRHSIDSIKEAIEAGAITVLAKTISRKPQRRSTT